MQDMSALATLFSGRRPPPHAISLSPKPRRVRDRDAAKTCRSLHSGRGRVPPPASVTVTTPAAGVELLREQLVGTHLDDPSAVPEQDPLHPHLGEPLTAAAARRRRDRRDDEVARPVALDDSPGECRRSAQTPRGYAAFSTFTPSTTRPSRHRTAQPTWNREYGAYARAAIASAAASSSASIMRRTPGRSQA